MHKGNSEKGYGDVGLRPIPTSLRFSKLNEHAQFFSTKNRFLQIGVSNGGTSRVPFNIASCFSLETKGAFFWGYSGCSYSGLGITEYTEFQFRKERSYMFQIWKRNRR